MEKLNSSSTILPAKRNILEDSLSTRSSNIKGSQQLAIELNLEQKVHKILLRVLPSNYSTKQKEETIKKTQQELSLILIEICEHIPDDPKCQNHESLYELEHLPKFLLQVQYRHNQILIILKNKNHVWFETNIHIKILTITPQNLAEILVHAKKQTLADNFQHLNFMTTITVDKNGAIQKNGTSFFYSKPLLNLLHYSYQNPEEFVKFCKNRQKDKLAAKFLELRTSFYSEGFKEVLKEFAEDDLSYIRQFYFKRLYITDYQLFDMIYETSKAIVRHKNPMQLFVFFFEILHAEDIIAYEALIENSTHQTPQMIYTMWYFCHITLTSIASIEKYRMPFYQLINKCILGDKIDSSGERLIFSGMINLFLAYSKEPNLISDKLTKNIILTAQDWTMIFDFYYLHCKARKHIQLGSIFRALSQDNSDTGEVVDWYGLFDELLLEYPSVFSSFLPEYYYKDKSNNEIVSTLSVLGKSLSKSYIEYKKSIL